MDKLDELRDHVLSVLLSHGAKRVAVFGSFARGEDAPGSDIDLLVAFKEPLGLFRLARVQRQLEERMGRKIDLVTEGGLSRHIRPFVEKEKQVIYEE